MAGVECMSAGVQEERGHGSKRLCLSAALKLRDPAHALLSRWIPPSFSPNAMHAQSTLQSYVARRMLIRPRLTCGHGRGEHGKISRSEYTGVYGEVSTRSPRRPWQPEDLKPAYRFTGGAGNEQDGCMRLECVQADL